MYRRMFEAEGSTWWVYDVYPSHPELLDAGLAVGWLCFDSQNELRRLYPIPEAWISSSDAELTRLLAQTTERVLRSSLWTTPVAREKAGTLT